MLYSKLGTTCSMFWFLNGVPLSYIFPASTPNRYNMCIRMKSIAVSPFTSLSAIAHFVKLSVAATIHTYPFVGG